MTIPKIDIFKYLRAFTEPDPVRDWRLLLSIFAVALIGTVVWNVLAFQAMISEKDDVPSATVDKAALDTAAIGAVKEVFKQRALEEVKYKTGEYRYTDPSQ